jgi:uncharacterized protein (TIGR02246 family)
MLALALAGLLAAGAPTPARPLLITVDDLPIAGRLHEDAAERRRITEGLLAALAKHQIQAVGFVTWKNFRETGDRELLAAWLQRGHELGNHTDQHLSLTANDAETWIADGERARVRLDDFLRAHGRALRFFRFPFLNEGESEAKLDAARAWLARTGQRNLTVTIDDQDWSFEEPWVEAQRAGDGNAPARVTEDYLAALRLSVRHAEVAGDRLLGRRSPQVLLLHANAVGAANWDRLFTWLEETGHRFANADEVLADPVFSELPRVTATHGFGLWDRLSVARREAEARDAVARLLARQAEAWTRGDLEAFCSVYAEDATFVTPSGSTHGRRQVLERYRLRYPGREAMGELTLEILETRTARGTEISLLDDAVPSRIHGVSVVARWTLRRAGRPDATGLTLLVLQPDGDGWRIVQDASM